MPQSELYKTKTEYRLARHVLFYGTANRQLSIKYGLVIFIPHELHNLGNNCIHKNKEFDLKIKKIAQREFEKKYSHDEFMRIFGKNYV